ncbi:PssE/Cps14G family polysaccharide biosynthesis glycosyltransferase [Jeotgalibaca sp. A122]|uniref:PssE/Cps14G family polysaccharide biosynthesis glycosyltransferase n=1 Tax=Jeotgalibaca sp. A122 TaxID=3457322 RepID=UPI003FCFF738
MIFITLGSQKFQFNRLLKKVDELIEDGTIKDEVFAQIGYSDYKASHFKYTEFLNRDEFSNTIEKCDIVITHGGTGAIISAVKNKKKVIAIPRLVKYMEHVDDHQLQIIEQFKEMNLIYGCKDCDNLGIAIEELDNISLKGYTSNKKMIINSIDEYIQSI